MNIDRSQLNVKRNSSFEGSNLNYFLSGEAKNSDFQSRIVDCSFSMEKVEEKQVLEGKESEKRTRLRGLPLTQSLKSTQF